MTLTPTPGPAHVPAPAPYLDELAAALGRARHENATALAAAAGIVARVVAADGIVYVFGSGHSQLAALELSRRAGSIASLQVIYDRTWGAIEHLEGYGEVLAADLEFGASDCLIAISHSGNTATAIDIARRARAAGTPVIVVTSVSVSRRAVARHSSGMKLSQLADVVLDDGAADADPGIHARRRGAAPRDRRGCRRPARGSRRPRSHPASQLGRGRPAAQPAAGGAIPRPHSHRSLSPGNRRIDTATWTSRKRALSSRTGT
jgi:uncharacterized phosphosugar-binding protein